MRLVIVSLVAGALCSSGAQAQESWSGAPVPPPSGSAGVISGSEYITAQCNLRAPGDFGCVDNPGAVREVYIPISSFARATTVEALRANVTTIQSQLGTLGGQVSAPSGQVSGLASQIGGFAGQIGGLDRRLSLLESSTTAAQRSDRIAARRGIAAAVAIGSAPMPSAPGRTSYDFNLSTFRGEQAIGGL